MSAPGRAELFSDRPIAGQIGKTLQIALKELQERFPDSFTSGQLEDYRITNSVTDVKCVSITNSTEASNKNIQQPNNIARLKEELKDVDVVLALGDKAQLAIEMTNFNGQVLRGSHPSFTTLNARFKSDKLTAEERTNHRIQQWVQTIK